MPRSLTPTARRAQPRVVRRMVLGTAAVVTLATLASGCGQEGTAGGAQGDPQVGAQLATTRGCTGCHSTDGSRRAGPSWKGLAGAAVELADGRTVTADAAYLRKSITAPGADVVKGYAASMPLVAFDDAQVDALVAYITSVSGSPRAATGTTR